MYFFCQLIFRAQHLFLLTGNDDVYISISKFNLEQFDITTKYAKYNWVTALMQTINIYIYIYIFSYIHCQPLGHEETQLSHKSEFDLSFYSSQLNQRRIQSNVLAQYFKV